MLTTILISSFCVSTYTVLKTVCGTMCFMSSMCNCDYDQEDSDEFGANSLIDEDVFKYEEKEIYLLNKLAS